MAVHQRDFLPGFEDEWVRRESAGINVAYYFSFMDAEKIGVNFFFVFLQRGEECGSLRGRGLRCCALMRNERRRKILFGTLCYFCI